MLNLSDKELDRLSREAAQEHDPGDILGSRSWEKLEPRLDKDLGRSGPNPLRGVRRFPIYYVPAILLVAGVFYFVKQAARSRQSEPSGSPPSVQNQSTPATKTIPLSTPQNPTHSINSTPSGSSSAASDPAAANTTVTQPAGTQNSAASSLAATNSTTANKPTTVDYSTGNTSNTAAATHLRTTGNLASSHHRAPHSKGTRDGNTTGTTTKTTNHANGAGADNTIDNTTGNIAGNSTNNNITATTNPAASSNSSSNASAATTGSTTHTTTPTTPRELTLSTIHGPKPQKQSININDSALRHYTAKTSPIQAGKNKSMHINRSLQFGLSIAPDFSSVNSLAGDKPGSTIGLTLDYQFANHWYLSTGLLLDRKNYAARPQDFHTPPDYYRNNNMHNIDFVKGSFNMLEIPLNLRYDFSVTGNTLFFASAGFSSYLLTNENCNYYFDMFGRQGCQSFNYKNQNNYLFASANLSLGVETGISNNLSLLVAPYVKIPSRNIGFGQVQVNSVGINFALKFTPVISRKRK